MSKHTWEVNGSNVRQAGKTGTLDLVCVVLETTDEGENAARANLIAASPDQNRVLRALAEWVEQGTMPGPSSLMPDSDTETFGEAILSAVSKAKGGES